MHIILLRFGSNKSAAPDHMASHKDWIAKGLADGVFQCVGSLDAGGGAVIAHGEDTDALMRRVQADPFVKHGVVKAEVLGVDVNRTIPALDYLMARAPVG
ncbi:YciI family protein [Loktanella agnita]|uniref:YciI family protein n=1 Tax=Loktanella agnita TaxID=287097 RepID=UPI003986747E